MCRTGGRRCPSTHDATARAAHNAQRRQAYAARRLAAGHDYTPRSGAAFGTQDNEIVSDALTQVSKQPPTNNPIAIGPPIPTAVTIRPNTLVENRWKHPTVFDDAFIQPEGKYRLAFGSIADGELYDGSWEDEEEFVLERPLVLLVSERVPADGTMGWVSWVKRVSDHYGGLIGDRLSDAIVNDGYDGVIVREGSYDEAVDGEVLEVLDLKDWRPGDSDNGLGDSVYSALSAKKIRKVDTYVDEELGIHGDVYEGELVENGLFARKSLVGKPDWSKIDESWSERMGFPGGFDTLVKRYRFDFDTRAKMIHADGLGEIESNAAREYNKELATYCGWEHDTINRAIVKGNDNCNDWIAKIDEALRLGGKQTRIVYRGTTLGSVGLSETPEIGDEIAFPTFQSTSLDPNVASMFARTAADREGGNSSSSSSSSSGQVIMEISTPAGMNVSSVSRIKGEAEVLLPRGARYVVVGRYSTDAAVVLQMVAVNSKGELLDGTNDDPPPPLPGN